MLRIVISILHYNNDRDTLVCLDSLLKSEIGDIELQTFVCDNGSAKRLEIDEDIYSKLNLKILRSSKNMGFTGGHNYIFERISNREFDYLLLLNNDLHFDPNFLRELLMLACKPTVGAVVPKIYFTRGHEYHKKRYRLHDLGKIIWYAGGYINWNFVQSVHTGLDEVDNGQFDEAREIEFASGACVLIKKEVLKKIGLFDNRYFLYYEDADLSVRLRKAGFTIMYQPGSIIWHNNSGSSGAGSELHDYFLTRNRLLFGLKYAPVIIKIHLLKESFKLLFSGRKWQQRGIQDFLMRKFGKGSFLLS